MFWVWSYETALLIIGLIVVVLQAVIWDCSSAVFEGCCFVIDFNWPWRRLLLQKGALLLPACCFFSLPAYSLCSSGSLNISMAGGELVWGNWLSWKLVLIFFSSRIRSLLQFSAQLHKGHLWENKCWRKVLLTIWVEAHAFK